MKNITHHIAYYLFVMIISIPLLYDWFGDPKKIEPLNGAYVQPKAKEWSLDGWMDQTYQENRDSVFKYNVSLRPTFIRLYNQIDFSLFSKYNMGDLLIGKDNYMFSDGWAKSRAGEMTLQDSTLDRFVSKLKQLEDTLRVYNKFFTFLIPPSKEELFSAFLPNHLKKEGELNDYKLLLSKLNKYSVSYVDLKPFYEQLMKKSKYPVYSKTSVHWTMYGAHFTTLMLLDSMNSHFNNTMPQLRVTDFEISQFKESDGDHEKTLNLFWKIDDGNFAYPKYETKTPNNPPFKPTVLTLGDSFYWGIAGSWQLPQVFSADSKYLYYYSTVYPNSEASSYPISNLNMVEEFKKADAFILINSSHNLNDFPYGMEKDIDEIINNIVKSSETNE